MTKIILIGRLTADPELRYTESGKGYTRFSLAVNRNFKNQNGEYDADFINIVAWDKRAEVICQSVKKGNRFGVAGRLQITRYEKQDGSIAYQSDVILEDFDFLESKPKNDAPAPDYPETVEDPFTDFGNSVEITDDDLPF